MYFPVMQYDSSHIWPRLKLYGTIYDIIIYDTGVQISGMTALTMTCRCSAPHPLMPTLSMCNGKIMVETGVAASGCLSMKEAKILQKNLETALGCARELETVIRKLFPEKTAVQEGKNETERKNQ